MFDNLSVLIVSTVLVIGLIDIVPIFKDWLSRIYIGRWGDLFIWNKSITKLGVKWLNKTPKIKVTDNIRLVILDIIKGNYTKSTIQDWQEASLILGISEYLNNYDDNKVKEELLKYLNRKFNKNGGWIKEPTHIDVAILAYSIMKINFINKENYKNALDHVWEMIKNHIGNDGTVEYRKSMKSYRYVDTIGFICPFLIAYGNSFKKTECIELAMKQIKEFENYGILKDHYIPFHTYNVRSKIPSGLAGWGRGLGWFAIGLIDSWNELPEGSKYKKDLEHIIKKFSKAVLKFQQESGNWNWSVSINESRPDSSTTATLCWFLLNASKINDISNECLEGVDKAFSYLMKVTRRAGAVDFSQGDTKGIGVYSMLFNILPFTQGFCIRSLNEYERVIGKKITSKVI
ncbi:glycoside hydrolase family 88 protein [Neobacillus sp. MER 74]|uniref:glycoside hydrolase family 88 protein n=1 Tax=Neobacillus sp. MER 74 TaxID=2939566 RepID=UPI0020422E19|nr:glycoside hydrolase family 88 protein [Neobacillus sp. MER 74]MCM3115085.1 glycoside hydrolase family 88 protein [Neobacillus sp. MER 74]